MTTPGPVARMPHLPALDGLRALSVLAVIAYHLGWGWAGGGYLGVEVFFVVSGFLITSLLLDEHERSGRIDLRTFWVRRARRLLPALFTMLAVVTAYAAWQVPDALARLRSDLVGAVLYVSNWWQVGSGQGYFDQLGRPPLLRHLWSLGVEEQWYLVWPLAFVGMMRWWAGRLHRMAAVLAGLAMASAAWMALIADVRGDTTRAYVGTDTRAAGLLIGAALACVFRPWRHPAAARRRLPVVDVAGLGALTFLAVAVVGYDTYGYFLPLEGLGPVLYRGGLLAASVASAVVIAAIVHPGGVVLPRLLATPVLQWIGTRSYGLYLWHWPVIVIFTEADTGMSRWPLDVFRIAITVACTEACYQFIETPIRRGTWSWRPVLTGGAVVTLLAPFVGFRLADAKEIDLATGPTVTAPTGAGAGADATAPTSVPGSITVASTVVADSVAPSVSSSVTTAVTSPSRAPRVVVVGDSQALSLVRNAPAAARSTFSLADGSIEGCGLFTGGSMRSTTGFRRFFDPCKDVPQRWARSVTSARADVALVLVGAWDVFDLDRGGSVLRFGTPEHDAALLATLRGGIEAVAGAGATTALLEVPCYRPIAAGGLPALPERGDDTRPAHLNELFRKVAAEYPGKAVVVPGPTAWCTDEVIATGIAYRWDGVHYWGPGAQLVFAAITAQLSSLSRPT